MIQELTLCDEQYAQLLSEFAFVQERALSISRQPEAQERTIREEGMLGGLSMDRLFCGVNLPIALARRPRR
jgi:hypothetical protein